MKLLFSFDKTSEPFYFRVTGKIKSLMKNIYWFVVKNRSALFKRLLKIIQVLSGYGNQFYV